MHFLSQTQLENSIYRVPYSQVLQKPFGEVEARMPMGPESPAKRALFGILVLHAASIRFGAVIVGKTAKAASGSSMGLLL